MKTKRHLLHSMRKGKFCHYLFLHNLRTEGEVGRGNSFRISNRDLGIKNVRIEAGGERNEHFKGKIRNPF